jgi:hypothetical protein
MNPKHRPPFLWLSCFLILLTLFPEAWALEPEQIEGRITQINEKQGTLTISGLVLDASDFELSDLRVGDWVMGEFIREKNKLRLIDLEVIK